MLKKEKNTVQQTFSGEAKYKAIVEAIPSLIFLCDKHGVFLDYHLPEGESLYTSPDHFLGKNIHNVFPSQLANYFEEAFQACVLIGKKQTIEYDLELGGIMHNYEAVITLCETDKLLTIATDITERKHAEKELKESLAWKESIFEGSRDAIFISDYDSKFIMVNQAACDLTGYSRKELLRMKIPDLHEPMDLNAYLYSHDKIMNGAEQLTESKILKKNGDKVDTEFNNKRILIDNNYYMHTTARDITERKQAEKALKDSEVKFRTVFYESPIGIELYNEKGESTAVNNASLEMFGLSNISDTRGFNIFNGISLDSEKKEKLLRGESIKYQTAFDFDKAKESGHYKNTKTGIKFFDYVITPLLDEKRKNINGYLLQVQDVTENKLAEEEIKIQNEKLLKINAEKDKFFSIIAHDLKSPFQGLLGMTELMADGSEEFTSENWVQNSKMLNRAAHNVYSLLDNLLEWSKVKRGLIDYTPNKLDLFKIVSKSIDSISDRALQKKITIENEIDSTLKVFADDRMILTVLRNLISNAVKFTKSGGKVTIKSERLSNGKIEISVADNGIGIAEENIEKLFKIEEKVRSLGTEGELSTGLGLLLCKEFIDIHGGVIWVESKENIGSTFSFCLPECG